MKPRLCPCGNLLGPHQKCYCRNECRAKYMVMKPKTKFGIPRSEERAMEKGIMAYLYGRKTLKDNSSYR